MNKIKEKGGGESNSKFVLSNLKGYQKMLTKISKLHIYSKCITSVRNNDSFEMVEQI